jgi:hypothetical protein
VTNDNDTDKQDTAKLLSISTALLSSGPEADPQDTDTASLDEPFDATAICHRLTSRPPLDYLYHRQIAHSQPHACYLLTNTPSTGETGSSRDRLGTAAARRC